MGKSPGRWIKTLIFGKKSSRSKESKPGYEKIDVVQVPSSQDQKTQPTDQLNAYQQENLHPHNSQDDICISATTELNAQNESDSIREEQAAVTLNAQNEYTKQEQAAIDLQAASRGCLARRSFNTLKGIVRLQALIRGHLVRRQAISTLYCMFQIVRFQALVRGTKIRNSVQVGRRCNLNSVGINTSVQAPKLSSNRFAQKILASSPTPMPLHFHYDSMEANSVLSWIDRWSTSQCWQLPPKPKSNHRSRPPKPHARRSSSITSVEIIASEFHKPIQNLRKVSSEEHVNYIEENPELVLERVKRNLRKVNNSILQSTNDSIQNIITKPEKLVVNEAETMAMKKNEKEEIKDDENAKERKKWRRVVSPPVKQELVENDEPSPIKIKRTVPGYMAATVSAKAKLKVQDGPENLTSLS